MAALSAMSGLLAAQAVLAHDDAQPLKVKLDKVGLPTAPCELTKLGCSFILDTAVVSGDVASHVAVSESRRPVGKPGATASASACVLNSGQKPAMHSAETGGGGGGGALGGRCGGGGEGGGEGGVHWLAVRRMVTDPACATVEPAPCITYLSTWSCLPNSL